MQAWSGLSGLLASLGCRRSRVIMFDFFQDLKVPSPLGLLTPFSNRQKKCGMLQALCSVDFSFAAVGLADQTAPEGGALGTMREPPTCQEQSVKGGRVALCQHISYSSYFAPQPGSCPLIIWGSSAVGAKCCWSCLACHVAASLETALLEAKISRPPFRTHTEISRAQRATAPSL